MEYIEKRKEGEAFESVYLVKYWQVYSERNNGIVARGTCLVMGVFKKKYSES